MRRNFEGAVLVAVRLEEGDLGSWTEEKRVSLGAPGRRGPCSVSLGFRIPALSKDKRVCLKHCLFLSSAPLSQQLQNLSSHATCSRRPLHACTHSPLTTMSPGDR